LDKLKVVEFLKGSAPSGPRINNYISDLKGRHPEQRRTTDCRSSQNSAEPPSKDLASFLTNGNSAIDMISQSQPTALCL